MDRKKIVIISGPTASGKTAYSIDFAKKNNGAIINADSMQIYKGLPILSAQPSLDERREVEHFLFSHLEPTENCNVGLWLKLAQEKIESCFNAGKIPIVVGGTGMYISKLMDGISSIPETPDEVRKKVEKLYAEIGYGGMYEKALSIDAAYTKKLNPNDRQRLMRLIEVYEITGKSIASFQKLGNKPLYPKEFFYHINFNPPRDILYERCRLRFEKLISDGVVEEIGTFSKKYPEIVANPAAYSASKTIGLMEGVDYISGKISLQEFIDKSVKITRNYAKRQYTWFNHQFESFDLRITGSQLLLG